MVHVVVFRLLCVDLLVGFSTNPILVCEGCVPTDQITKTGNKRVGIHMFRTTPLAHTKRSLAVGYAALRVAPAVFGRAKPARTSPRILPKGAPRVPRVDPHVAAGGTPGGAHRRRQQGPPDA